MSEARLTADKKIWPTGTKQDLQVEYQLQGGGDLTGIIQFGTGGQWLDVSSGPWFEGSTSPFQVDRSGNALVVQVNQPPTGSMDFRVVLTGGDSPIESNSVAAKIINKSPAPAPDKKIYGRKW